MEHLVEIVDNGNERYTIKTTSNVLGRQWDNNAESLIVRFPQHEIDTNSTCTMVVAIGNLIIDYVAIQHENPKPISNFLSKNELVKIGFFFSNENGYIKETEPKNFVFLSALKPDEFIEEQPEQKANINELLSRAVVAQGLDGNNLWGKNLFGEKVISFDLSPFTQAQRDLSEEDSSKEIFVKGKKTSNLVNDGENGNSPYVSQEYVEDYVNTHGGGSGTSNYEFLTNKPKINGVELTGNKTSSDLGILDEPQVVANPEEVATADLQKLQVGDTVYKIPQGISGGTENWRVIQHITTTEDITELEINQDSEGNPFRLKKARLTIRNALNTHARFQTFADNCDNVYFYSVLSTTDARFILYELSERSASGLRRATLNWAKEASGYQISATNTTNVAPLKSTSDYFTWWKCDFYPIQNGSLLAGAEIIFEGVDYEETA